MRLASLIAALMMSAPALAQELVIPPVDYPVLPATAKSAEGFVPKGWRLESRSDGDLNNDGRSDLVLVLRQQRASNIVRHDGMGQNPLDTNPRILAVAWSRADGGYALAVQNHALIPATSSRRSTTCSKKPEACPLRAARCALCCISSPVLAVGQWAPRRTASAGRTAPSS
ncbi:hypothetical protein [Cupriavidus laharis]|uniref:hypothetical protein n=1 Tax=Cupriavidus laharis TaxID=151654 RepID=UPI001CC7FBDE|nr:hypothetical protein [Cupriavidus laharis]